MTDDKLRGRIFLFEFAFASCLPYLAFDKLEEIKTKLKTYFIRAFAELVQKDEVC